MEENDGLPSQPVSDALRATTSGSEPSAPVRIGRLKFHPGPSPGYKRSYWRCKTHGVVATRDYIPYSLANPIIGPMPCGCSAHPLDRCVEVVEEQEGKLALLRQHEAALARTETR